MMWGTAQDPTPVSAANCPPVDLRVTMEAESSERCNKLAEGIRSLFDRRELCDVHLVVGEESFSAHQAMIASMSPKFEKYLQQLRARNGALPLEVADDALGGLLTVIAEDQPTTSNQSPGPDSAQNESKQAFSMRNLKLQVNGISYPEAIKILLRYIYRVGTGDASWVYEPSRAEVNKDVLHLARQLDLMYLHEHAARWLAHGLTTKNCVERLVMCEEFGLNMLREKIIEQLSKNPAELLAVSSCEEVVKHPRILQALICQVATLTCMNPSSAPERPVVEKVVEKSIEKPASEKVASTSAASSKPQKTAPERPTVEKPVEKSVDKPVVDKIVEKPQPPSKKARRAAGA